MDSFDVIVIGAGPAGEVLAGRLADAGQSVAIAEEHLVGGECAYYACMPSKALLRPAEAIAEARRVPGAAEAVTGKLSAAAVLARRDEIIHDRDDAAQIPWLENHGIELLRGRARITGERQIEVGGRTYTADRAVVLATGSSALLPPVPGLAESSPWTNREATTAKEVPDRLIVLGGGPVGVELAQAWRTLGAAVTLISGSDRVLPHEEDFASAQVGAALTELGIDVRSGQRAERVERDSAGVRVTLTDGTTVTGDELLIGVGRRPSVGDLGLDAIGLDADGPVETDAQLRVVGAPWLYAVGDVNGRALLTHMGKYQARIAADHLLGKDPALLPSADGRLSPRVVFTDPQVAAVGHTTETAADAGLRVRIADAETSGNAGGSFFGRGAPGTTRLLLDEDRRVLVGATFSGSGVEEMLHAATIAIVAKVPVELLGHAVPAFPTRSEVWLPLLEQFE